MWCKNLGWHFFSFGFLSHPSAPFGPCLPLVTTYVIVINFFMMCSLRNACCSIVVINGTTLTHVLSRQGHLNVEGLSWSNWTCSCKLEDLSSERPLVLKERLESALYSTTRRLKMGQKAGGTSYEKRCWFSINKLFIMLKNWETGRGFSFSSFFFFSSPNVRLRFILYPETKVKKPRLKQNWTKWCTPSTAVRTAPIFTGTKQPLHRRMAQHGRSES